MGDELPRREVEALYSLLARRSHPAMGEVEFHAVKNQVLDKLLDQRPLPPDLGRTLVALFRDRGHAELLGGERGQPLTDDFTGEAALR
jgi:hypothetical protein